MSREVKIIFGIALVVIVGGFFLFRGHPQQQPGPAAPADGGSLVRENSIMTGSKDAKVQVVEFGDYECPACGLAAPILSRLREEYKDNPNVNFVFRHFPLPQHSKAIAAAEAAEAALTQGKFWQMTDKIYETQSQWGVPAADHKSVFIRIAGELGMDVAKFQDDLNEGEQYRSRISGDKADGQALRVNSTPTFYINGQKMSGFGYDVLKSKIEESLK